MALSPIGYILVSVAVGFSLGVLLQKARFCFVSAFRDFVAFKDTRVLKGLLAGIFVMTLFWSTQATLGYFRGFWTPAWGLGSVIGGVVFGLGMTLAGGCASGTLYRAGQGYLQFWLVLVFMFVGYGLFALVFPFFEVQYFARLNPFDGTTLYLALPFSPAATGAGAVVVGLVAYAYVKGKNALPEDPPGGTDPSADRGTRGQATLSGPVVAVSVGLRGIVAGSRSYLRGWMDDDRQVADRLRDSWDARTSGIAMALVASVWFWVHGHWAITGAEARWAGWLVNAAGADAAGIRYFGSILFRDGNITVTMDMLMIVALVAGSFVAAYSSGDFRIRTPNRDRLPNYIIGGLLMGVGSRLAAGCNIANLFSGVALLSVHSFLAGAGIIAGVYLMTHYMYREVGCAI
ncbi:MAG: putative transporter component [uncultured archaeon A07HR60]|nr:MAG: putative transporter component [uncultured archaeon A07HR60]